MIKFGELDEWIGENTGLVVFIVGCIGAAIGSYIGYGLFIANPEGVGIFC